MGLSLHHKSEIAQALAAQPGHVPLLNRPAVDLAAPALTQPISQDPNHPVNQENKTVYLPRSNNLAQGGLLLPDTAQIAVINDTLRNAGPKGTVSIEVTGTNGVYGSQVMPLYAKAVESIPVGERPHIELLSSGGRPSSTSPLGALALAHPDGNIGTINEYGVNRVLPNWGNSVMASAALKQLDEAIESGRKAGVEKFTVAVDDNFGIVNYNRPEFTAKFKQLNGLPAGPEGDKPAQAIVTGFIGQMADRVHDAGGEFKLSLVGPFNDARAAGIDVQLIAPKIDRLEFQLYRADPKVVADNLDKIHNELAGSINDFSNLKRIDIALAMRANGHDLTEAESIGQHEAVLAFQERLNKLCEANGINPPIAVAASLWERSKFYKQP